MPQASTLSLRNFLQMRAVIYRLANAETHIPLRRWQRACPQVVRMRGSRQDNGSATFAVSTVIDHMPGRPRTADLATLRHWLAK